MSICWKISLKNGEVLCFNCGDEEIIYQNERYISANHPGAIFSSNELGEDSFSISGFMNENTESIVDAHIELFLLDCNFKEKIILKTGWLGEIKYDQYKFTAKILTLGSKYNNLIGNCYSSSCRAEFGDALCKADLKQYSFIGNITALAEKNSFIDLSREEPDGYFINGILTFKDASKYKVKEFRDKKFTLDINLKASVGDWYKITVGCDKSLYCCINKFNNAINFRGEPFIPSRQKLVARL